VLRPLNRLAVTSSRQQVCSRGCSSVAA
jgi:hypothetical protein